jgi:Tfp pilus assembly protein PilW
MKLHQNIRRPTGARPGMTLLEMMVALVLGMVIMGLALSLLVFSARTFAGLGNYDELNRKSRNALDVMTKDIRESQHLIGFVSNSTVQQLIFTNPPGSSPPGFSYNYTNSTATYNPGTLTRTWNAQNTLLLSNIVSLAFGFSQRNPSNNFTFYPAAIPANTKLIDVSWNCSRSVGGATFINSESIQTAKIVVRN